MPGLCPLGPVADSWLREFGDPDQTASGGGPTQPWGQIQLGEATGILASVIVEAGAGAVLNGISSAARNTALAEGVTVVASMVHDGWKLRIRKPGKLPVVLDIGLGNGGGHVSWLTPRVENWPTPRVVNWPIPRVVNWPTLFQRVVNWLTEKLEVGLQQFWRGPIFSSRVVSWPTKNCKLVYTILCVGQLQV